MNRHWAVRLLAPIAWATQLGCVPSEPYIDAQVRLRAADAAQVTIGAGRDRHTFNRLDPGEPATIRLTPGRSTTRADERRLFVSWWVRGQRYEWSGPDLPMAASYRIRLDLLADGRVESAHCVLPCTLAPP
jgi:hypothetical protein